MDGGTREDQNALTSLLSNSFYILRTTNPYQSVRISYPSYRWPIENAYPTRQK